MRAELVCWFLGGSLVCSILVLLLWAVWFFRQWRCMEAVLEMFQNGNGLDGDWADHTIDIQETRESRMASDMQQILHRAAWRENEAVRGKQQVTELLSDLSHQLKTPLANIILDIDLLSSDAGSMREQQKQEFFSHARAQARTMQWLMQNLLKASRLEEGILQFPAENICIKPTIAKAVSAVYAQASGKRIEIVVKETDDMILYHNPKWTAEAMTNVLENAVKYSPEGSRIVISMEKMDIYTRITVRDQGPGISETEYNKIFQRFYRGRQAQAEEGVGLGLYLAQLILQSEQGYLTVDSKLNQGSQFHFFLLNKQTDHGLDRFQK